MAVVEGLPPKGVIRGFRGLIDFYKWKDKTIARSWPRKYKGIPPLGVRLAQIQNRLIMAAIYDMNPCYREALVLYTTHGNWTFRDYLFRLHFGKAPSPVYNPVPTPYFDPPAPHHPPIHFDVTKVYVLNPPGVYDGRLVIEHTMPQGLSIARTTYPPVAIPIQKEERGQKVFCGYDWKMDPRCTTGGPGPFGEPFKNTAVFNRLWGTTPRWEYIQWYLTHWIDESTSPWTHYDCYSVTPIFRVWVGNPGPPFFGGFAALDMLRPTVADLSKPPPTRKGWVGSEFAPRSCRPTAIWNY